MEVMESAKRTLRTAGRDVTHHEVPCRPAQGHENQYLRGEQHAVRKRSAVPRFESRERRALDDERQWLGDDPKCEEGEQNP
jgi:hypothetical protein